MNKSELIRTVENAQDGSKKAFEALYGEYYDKLYFFVLKNVGRKDVAEDITQESFLKAMEGIHTLENPENFGTWLHSIAFHKCKDIFRKEKRSAYFDSDEEMEAVMENVSLNEPVMVPEDYATNKERAKELKQLIDELKPDMKSAVILYYYDNMSVADVAKTLGMNENSAKQKLFQARKKLKAKIEKMAGSGAVMCAVPMGDMLKNTVSPKYVAAVRTSSSAAVTSAAMGTKIAAAAAAAVMAVGIPLGLGLMNKNDDAVIGDVLPDESSSYISVAYTNESSTPEKSAPDSSVPDSSISESSRSEGSAPESTNRIILDSSQNDTADSSGSVSDDTTTESRPETVITTQNNDESRPESSSADVSASQTERVEMSVDKMLSMDGAQLRALSNDQYDIVLGKSGQAASFGLKCAAFPEYVFLLQRVEGMDNKPENTIKVTYGDFDYELSDKIEELNLYEGADVGGGITVGMTYNEIEEILGHDIYMSATFSVLPNAAWTEIDGKYWALSFDLTYEQLDELQKRLDASTEKGKISMDDPGSVDISDMNPVCNLAVYNIDADNAHYGRLPDGEF